MSKVAIVTDSSPYIPADIIKANQIHVGPLTVIWGEETFYDGVDITPVEFYQRLETAKVMPSTSQPSVADFEVLFRSLHQQGYEILAVLLSEVLSGTISSATQAKKLLPEAKIEIVNSKTLAMALGFQVLAAARAANQGKSLEECKRLAEESRDRTGVIFVLDTLEFLHRGGRIGGAKRFMGTLLNVKPVLAIEDGVIVPLDSVRTQKKALTTIIDLVAERTKGKKNIRLATLHANNPVIAQEVLDEACRRIECVEQIFSEVSPVIGTHAGPGAVGLAYMYD
ncbi:MAG: DegV family protein [Anaerolineales bacterium]|nr:DegV family protein [Anaerolineales bacterium]